MGGKGKSKAVYWRPKGEEKEKPQIEEKTQPSSTEKESFDERPTTDVAWQPLHRSRWVDAKQVDKNGKKTTYWLTYEDNLLVVQPSGGAKSIKLPSVKHGVQWGVGDGSALSRKGKSLFTLSYGDAEEKQLTWRREDGSVANVWHLAEVDATSPPRSPVSNSNNWKGKGQANTAQSWQPSVERKVQPKTAKASKWESAEWEDDSTWKSQKLKAGGVSNWNKSSYEKEQKVHSKWDDGWQGTSWEKSSAKEMDASSALWEKALKSCTKASAYTDWDKSAKTQTWNEWQTESVSSGSKKWDWKRNDTTWNDTQERNDTKWQNQIIHEKAAAKEWFEQHGKRLHGLTDKAYTKLGGTKWIEKKRKFKHYMLCWERGTLYVQCTDASLNYEFVALPSIQDGLRWGAPDNVKDLPKYSLADSDIGDDDVLTWRSRDGAVAFEWHLQK